MCWKWTNYGRLSAANNANAGYGRLSIAGLDKSLPLSWVTAVPRPAVVFGANYPLNTTPATVIAIFGMLMDNS